MYLNTRGFNISGRIANKIGFFSSITDNQERGPKFFQQNVLDVRSVPGGGYYQNYKTLGIDYFDGRGYITFNTAKYIDIQFGYDYSKKIIQRSVKKKSFGSIFCQNCLKILMTDPYYVNC